MASNYRQIFARQKAEDTKLKKLGYDIPATSGIYTFNRYSDEKGKVCIYVGQAVSLKKRIISHITGYSQHIDISIKKHGLSASVGEIDKWHITWFCCSEDLLDQREKDTIALYNNNDEFELYNITGGGQGKGKEDINERKPTKGYLDGLAQGYSNCLKLVRDYFKYLTPCVDQFKKDGTPTELAKRKLKEFEELINK